MFESEGRGFKPLYVFISSPNNVADARQRVKQVIARLNKDVARDRGVELIDLMWEEDAPGGGGPPQDIIEQFNMSPEKYHYFLGILWHRYGMPPGGVDEATGRPYRSGFEREFLKAYRHRQEKGAPEILVYRCRAAADPDEVDDEQNKLVKQFFRECAADGEHPTSFSAYQTLDELADHVRSDLTHWLKKNFPLPQLDQERSRITSIEEAVSIIEGVAQRYTPPGADVDKPEIDVQVGSGRITIVRSLPSMPDSTIKITSSASDRGEGRAAMLTQEMVAEARNNLLPPTALANLVGRQSIFQTVSEAVLSGRLPFLIYGMAGIGKSTLLAAVANDSAIQQQFGGEIYWIDLRKFHMPSDGSDVTLSDDATGLAEVVDEIAKALNLPGVLRQRPRHKLRALGEALRKRQGKRLFVFDNADLREHVDILTRFRSHVTASVLVGSRTSFLRSSIRDDDCLELTELQPNDAVILFRAHARLTRPDDGLCNELCTLLGNHPQAILLAAPNIWQRGLSLVELKGLLTARRMWLLQQGAPEADLNMRLAFEFSYGDLQEEERRVFDTLGAFASTGAFLSAIADVAQFGTAEARVLLTTLDNCSLVIENEREIDPQLQRYTMHPLLHDFAREKLAQREDAMVSAGVVFADRPTGRFVQLYANLALRHKDDYQTFATLEREKANLLEASEWAWKQSTDEALRLFCDLAEGLDTWLDASGDWSNLSIFQDRAIVANRKLNRSKQLAAALQARSTYRELTGQINAARADVDESLAIGEELDDPKIVAPALTMIGELLQEYTAAFDEGHGYFERAWDISGKLDGWIERSYIAYKLAFSWWTRGDLTRARELFEEARRLAASATDCVEFERLRYESYALTSIGNLLVQQHDYESARSYLERALELKKRLGNRYSIAISISSLADLEQNLGRYSQAEDLQQESLEIYREIGATSAIADRLREIGGICVELGDVERALRYYREAWAVAERFDDPRMVARILQQLGQAYVSLQRYDQAIETYEECLQRLQQMPLRDPLQLGATYQGLGEVYVAQGDLNRALRHLQLARNLLTEAQNVSERATALLRIAEVLEQLGSSDDAIAVYEERLRLLDLLPTHDPNRVGITWMGLGRVQEKADRLASARDSYLRAHEEHAAAKDTYETLDALDALRGVHERLGDHSQAAAVAREFQTMLSELKQRALSGDDSEAILALAQFYLGKNLLDDAAEAVERAIHEFTSEQQPGDRHPSNLNLRIAGVCGNLGAAFRSAGRTDDSIGVWEKVLTLVEGTPLYWQRALVALGSLYSDSGDLKTAVEYYKRARDVVWDDADPGERIALLLEIANVSQKLGRSVDLADARLATANLVAEQEARVATTKDTSFLYIIVNYFTSVHELDRVERLLERIGELITASDGLATPYVQAEQLAGAYDLLGRDYERAGDYTHALAAYQKALTRLESDGDTSERDWQYYGVVLHDIANVYRSLGQFEKAREYYEQASKAKAKGANIRDRTTTLVALASILLDLERPDDAAKWAAEGTELIEPLIAIDKEGEPEYKSDLARLGRGLVLRGRIELARGRSSEAASHLERARVLFVQAGEIAILDLIEALKLLASTYQTLHLEAKMAEARVQIHTLLEEWREQALRTHNAEAMLILASYYLEEEQFLEVKTLLDEIVEVLEESQPADPADPLVERLAVAYDSLGRAYERDRKYEQALAAYRSALTLLTPERDWRYYGVVLHDLADAHRGLGLLLEAQDFYSRADQAKARAKEPDYLDHAVTLEALATTQFQLNEMDMSRATIQRAVAILDELQQSGSELGHEATRRLIRFLQLEVRIALTQRDWDHALDRLNRARFLLEQIDTSLQNLRDRISLLLVLESVEQLAVTEGVNMPTNGADIELSRLVEEAISKREFETPLAVARHYLGEDTLSKAQDILSRLEVAIDNGRSAIEYDTIEQIAAAWDSLGRAFGKKEQYESALEAYQKARSNLTPERDWRYYGVILHDIGDAYRGLDDLSEAINYYEQAAQAKRKAVDQAKQESEEPRLRDLATTLLAIASTHRAVAVSKQLTQAQRESEWDTAVNWAQEAIDAIKEAKRYRSDAGDALRLARMNAVISDVARQKGDDSLAISALEEATTALRDDAAPTPEVIEERAAALALLIEAYQRVGRIEDANSTKKELEGLLGNQVQLTPGALLTTASIYLSQQQPERAQPYIDQASELLASTPGDDDDVRQLAAAYHRLGRVYEKVMSYSRALVAYQEAIKRLIQSDDYLAYGVVLHDIGDVQLAMGQKQQAREKYREAVASKRQSLIAESQANGTEQLLLSIEALAPLDVEFGELDDALSIGNEGLGLLETASEFISPGVAVQHLSLMAQLWMAKGEWDRALAYIQSALDLSQADSSTMPQSVRGELIAIKVKLVALRAQNSGMTPAPSMASTTPAPSMASTTPAPSMASTTPRQSMASTTPRQSILLLVIIGVMAIVIIALIIALLLNQ